MTRLITYSRHTTYSLDAVIENLRENTDTPEDQLEYEAREQIKGWAEEDFGMGSAYLSVEEETIEEDNNQPKEY